MQFPVYTNLAIFKLNLFLSIFFLFDTILHGIVFLFYFGLYIARVQPAITFNELLISMCFQLQT